LPYNRKDLMDDLYLQGGSAVYAVAPDVIPDKFRTITIPYGETYRVLRLKRKKCPAEGTTMEHIDWAGVEPGVYVESKAWLLVEVFGDGPITESESRAPVTRLVRPRRFTVRPIGTIRAEWSVDNKGQMHRAHMVYPPNTIGGVESSSNEPHEVSDSAALKKLVERLLVLLDKV